MTKFLVSAKARIAAEIFDLLKHAIGLAAASKFMFCGHEELDGRSPIQALKQGDETKVRAVMQRKLDSK